jgi:hypothetical protein
MVEGRVSRRELEAGLPVSARIQKWLFWAAAGSVLVAAPSLDPARPAGWLGFAAIAVAIFAVQALLDLATPGSARRWWRLALPAALYLGVACWAALQALPAIDPGWAHPAWAGIGLPRGPVSAEPGATWQALLRLLGYGALFWVAVQGAGLRARARTFVSAVALWAGFMSALRLVLEVAGGMSLLGAMGVGASAGLAAGDGAALYAGVGVIAAIAALALRAPRRAAHDEDAGEPPRAMPDGPLLGRWPYLAALVVSFLGVLVIGSGPALVSVLGGMLVQLSAARGWLMGRRGLLATLLLLLALALALFVTAAPPDRPEGAEGGARLALQGRVIAGIEARPLVGHGLGAFQEAFRAYQTEAVGPREVSAARNAYLEAGFELGLPAAAAIHLAILWVVVRCARGALHRRRMRPVPAFALGAAAAMALHAVAAADAQAPAIAALIAMALGVGLRVGLRSDEETLR